MSSTRRKCLGHPEDTKTAHLWAALTGLPTDYHEPGTFHEGMAGLEQPVPEVSTCPRHAPMRRERRPLFGLLEDRIHPTSGPLIKAWPIRVRGKQ